MPTEPHTASTGSRPLSALLSQILVAYTVEFDSEFERRMSVVHPGTGISLTIFYTVMRFLDRHGVSVEQLARQSIASADTINFQLGCLERWRFLTLQPDPSDQRPIPQAFHRMAGRQLRRGWGSGRGIRDQWIVQLTTRGRSALEIWPPLFEDMDQRWRNRFGPQRITDLRNTLADIVAKLKSTPPDAPPPDSSRTAPGNTTKSLPALLSLVLLAFAHEFNRDSPVSLGLCANTLRVLGATAIPERDIPRLTGCSPETSAIGWQLKPFILVESGKTARRGKMVRLNARGLAAQATYTQLVQEIERRWLQRFGAENIRSLRHQLEQFFTLRNSGGLLLSQGLVAPKGVRRAGHQTASLGAGVVGVAARNRTRDLVQQTAASAPS
ncbi:MAG TPA: hypothetical protein VEJ47_09565 [Candidatus Eremiobacteraceae bacterium]|nr:hypothetical protein [Candidatus Eremiobacteraceae bacterium]